MTVDYTQPHPHDTLSAAELELYQLIMDYRASLGLPAIPLSNALTVTAGRHVVDTHYNFLVPNIPFAPGTNLHSWSDAPYYADHSAADVMWYAPERVGAPYPDAAFEISHAGSTTVEGALSGWQGSPGHNNVIVNANPWVWDWNAIGIGAYMPDTYDFGIRWGGFVYHVWFGRVEDPTGAPLIEGTAAAEMFEGTQFDDTIDGGGGSDTILGGQGTDRVIFDVAREAAIVTQSGTDLLIRIGSWTQTSRGIESYVFDGVAYTAAQLLASQPEVPVGEQTGTAGNDTLSGGAGEDTIAGGAGDDVLAGAGGHDGVYGQDGHDVLYGEDGNDTMGGGDGNDVVEGGEGSDSLGGGTGDDTLRGDAGDDTLGGGQGNDRVEGGEGHDVAGGGAGDDTLSGGAGNDVMGGGLGQDSIDGGTGNDNLGGGAGQDWMSGGAGDDSFGGGEANDTIYGGDGADFLAGGGRNDVLYGGSGDDRLNGGAGNDQMYGGAGRDTFIFNGGVTGDFDVINDFTRGEDVIRLSGVSREPGSGMQGYLDALQLRDYFGSAALTYDGQTIILQDVAFGALTVDDFIFV